MANEVSTASKKHMRLKNIAAVTLGRRVAALRQNRD
jgi:hypothetical protein